MKVLVTGGRYYGALLPGTPRENLAHERKRVDKELFMLNETLTQMRIDGELTSIIHGGATGADAAAAYWAKRTMIECQVFKADWKTQKRAAGPIRNQRMIDEGRPDLVVAFLGGDGTADMVKRARKAGIEVREIA
jgi:predicted polyphosphate/ATP-dependent NAD kinase